MTKQKEKTALIVVLAVIVVMALLLLLYRLLFKGPEDEGISLPEPVVTVNPAQEPAADQNQTTFLEITPQTLPELLESLNAPAAYYQQSLICLYAAEQERPQTVELWQRDQQVRVRVTDLSTQTVKNLLYDGETTYIWYDLNTTSTQVIDAAASVASLSGLPEIQSLRELPVEQIVETSYVTLEQSTQQSCLYARTQRTDTAHEQWWVSLDTGLPVEVRRFEDGTLYYAMQQVDFRLLTPADSDYETAFQLPS